MFARLKEYFFTQKLDSNVKTCVFHFVNGSKLSTNTITFEEGITYSEMLTVAISTREDKDSHLISKKEFESRTKKQ